MGSDIKYQGRQFLKIFLNKKNNNRDLVEIHKDLGITNE